MTAVAAQPTSSTLAGTTTTQRGYRPDIDGLRAIAVFTVVAFHAGIAYFPGGFIGVDIFFVISGYLIGGQIAQHIANGTFSYVDFYARRARRILPALFAMLLVMLVLGLLALTPREFEQLGKEGVATVFGLSNILYFLGRGYFEPAAENNPLLMTWSLGVEEQFYFVFPMVMLLLARWRRGALFGLVALTLVSLLGSLLMIGIDPQGAFYLLPPRAWELGLGASLALWPAHGRALPLPGYVREFSALAACLVLAAGVASYHGGIPFPGIFALLPTAAAAVLIATRESWLNRWVLGQPLVTFLGRVSYSWYLWHWPLFYFNRLVGVPAPPLALLFGSLALGILSWRFIEQPLRLRVLPPEKALIRYGVAALALASVFALTFVAKGWPQRLSAPEQRIAAEARAARDDACLARYGVSQPDLLHCVTPATTQGQETLVLLGDSHASALAPAFHDVAASRGMRFAELTKSSCPGLWNASGALPDHRSHWRECREFQQAAFRYIEAHPEVRTVVIAGFWSSDLVLSAETAAGRTPVTLPAALSITAARLVAQGRRVFLVQDAPILRFDPYARVLGEGLPLRSLAVGWFTRVTSPELPTWDLREDRSRRELAAVAAHVPGVELLDPRAGLCGSEGCRFIGPEGLYYFDFQHLTAAGARRAIGKADIIAPVAR